ncbi:MucBP domain-containing protein [Breznakia pachnodae]|uniref:MucBP domain-containing protein n=1 Tax=Breznakia pachnodae TaxID=265178 RepID=A0ABU0E8S9_9FIRM|nr:MucBP domain-containing protein [Breznakia pachnodae]MDQ0363098.1 hypothetical protein [Breznakia pachnodae]
MRVKQLLKKVGVATLVMMIVSANMIFNNDIVHINAGDYEIEVDKDNVTDKFNFNGTASYNQDSGIATLTEDVAGQSGNITINEKISLSDAFSLTLDINIGNKPQGGQGGDGMAFFFHTGEVSDVGSFGNAFGAGFLSDVVGFKIDTTNNNHDEPYINAVADPNRVWWDPGISLNRTGSWYGYNNSVYGAFFYSNPNNYGVITTWGDTAYNTPHNTNGDDDIKGLSNPTNNEFKEITIDYDGNGIMKVNYDGEYWEIDIVNTFNMDLDDEYVFTISGSTGSFTNYHQVKFGDITYTPSEENGQVIVKYENEAGTGIADSVTLVGEVGSTYTTTQKTIDNYQFKEMKVGSAAASGTYIDGSLTVTYVYEPVTLTQGTVIAKYENEAGAEISGSVSTSGNVGSTYTTTQKTIDNYTFKEMKAGSAATSGNYTNGTQIVTYVYKANPLVVIQGTVIAKYEDESGTEIAASVITTGAVGNSYTTIQKTINGYTFKEMKVGSANVSGNYVNGTLTVTYVYKKNIVSIAQGSVISNYVDEAGNTIAPSITTTGTIGTNYNTQKKDINGYTFSNLHETSASASGKYANGVQTVIYVYTRDSGKLIVRHEASDGKLLENESVSVRNTGETYVTIQKEFDGYVFKEVKAGSHEQQGVYEKDVTKVVTYVYELDDEDKVVIFTPSIASPSGNPSVAVNTSDSTNISFYLMLMVLTGGVLIVGKQRRKI